MKTLPSKIICLLTMSMLFVTQMGFGQWLNWQNATSTRLTLSTVANSDPEEKDMWAADIDNDGDEDLIVVRKQPFSNQTQPGKSNLLLINVNGHLTDLTQQYAPQFIDSVNFARDVFVDDFDNDGWKDVVIANTFSQQPKYYKNLGNDSLGNWLGLTDQSTSRFPLLTDDTPLFCAVWGGDINGDSHKDLYFLNYKPNSGGGIAKDYILINNGSGVFTNESQARLGTLRNSAFGTAVQITDIDNDGDNDVIKNTTLYSVSPWNSRGVIVLYNNGSGFFTEWQNLVPSGSPYMFEIADFNKDGKKDLYVVDDGSDYILWVHTIIPNDSIKFKKVNLGFSNTNGFGGNVHAADLDLDGDLDIAVSDVDVDIPPCNSSRRFALYRNDSTHFSNVYDSTSIFWKTNSYDFFWIDINSDGLKDFVSGACAGYIVAMNDNCGLAPSPADYDLDGLSDNCDPCPTNPDPNCLPSTEYPQAELSKSIARQWNELLLASIRKDFARPTVHARNLFHVSAAMWDAWSAYDNKADEFLLGKTVKGFNCPYTGIPTSTDITNDRKKAISFAAYRLLKHRFALSPQYALLLQGYDHHMDTLGYNINDTTTDYSGGNAIALGNYIAQCYISFGLQDSSNEQNAYANISYTPVNPPLNVDVPGNSTIVDRNRWQPLTLDLFIDQSGNPIPGATPEFLGPEWGSVTPFALNESVATYHPRGGWNYKIYQDPGSPPLLSMDGSGTSEYYKWGFSMVSIWSSHLSPSDSVMWDISPASLGNKDSLPSGIADYANFYNYISGGSQSNGHTINPYTGNPYAPNLVPRGDYARVLAEFWADGPDSETPPGHWFTLFNHVSDDSLLIKKYRGTGNVMDDLEWDVKGYLTLGGGMHDVAISIWGLKGYYDYLRPISAIRALAALGQSSDSMAISYHPAGIPLVPGYIELVLSGDPLASGTTNIGKIKIKAWKGHSYINNVDEDEAGVDWILAQDWLPYQRPSFVTPPFAGYLSGHSTYSRAAAEILTTITGSPYFPGGLGTFLAKKDEFLVFEDGPSVDVELQWATYEDAAAESALSRIWGGIHPPCDDIPGRKIAVDIAKDVVVKAETIFCPCVSPPAMVQNLKGVGGNTKHCPGDLKSYKIKTQSDAIHYNWIPPQGASVVSGQGTEEVEISFDSGFLNADYIKVAAVNSCGEGPYDSLLIERKEPYYPTPIVGQNHEVCINTSEVYQVSDVGGMTYDWTAPNGSTISSGQGTYQVTVDFGAGFTGDHIRVVAETGCGISAERKRRIYSVPIKPSAIQGPTNNLCGNNNVVFSVNSVANVTYNWSVPAGAIITSGQGTNSISVDFTNAINFGDVEVVAVNACGDSPIQKVSVRKTPDASASMSGPSLVCANQSAVSYSCLPVVGATNYRWIGPAGSTISDGNQTSSGNALTTTATSVQVNFGNTAGKVKVKAKNACGAGKKAQISVAFNCRSSKALHLSQIEAYPNPTMDFVNLSGVVPIHSRIKITLFDMPGKEIYSIEHTNTSDRLEQVLDLQQIAPGMYFIHIVCDDMNDIIKIQKQ